MVRWSCVNFQCRASYSLDDSRARANCACSRCGWGNFIAGHPKAALLFWFFGGFRCGVPLFIVMLVIY